MVDLVVEEDAHPADPQAAVVVAQPADLGLDGLGMKITCTKCGGQPWLGLGL